MTLQETFIANLKKIRKERGISQMALAELCDSSGNYIGEIEMGRRIPSFEKIDKIAAALDVAAHELFLYDTAPPPVTRDYLAKLPITVKKAIAGRLVPILCREIEESLNAENY